MIVLHRVYFGWLVVCFILVWMALYPANSQASTLGCADTLPSGVSDDVATAAAILAETNKHRESLSLGALEIDAKLQAAADWKARDMAARSYFDHADKPGATDDEWRTFRARMIDCGIEIAMTAENIAAGYPSATAVVAGWIKSDGHRMNLEQAEYTHIGIGVANNPASDYGVYYVQVFGKNAVSDPDLDPGTETEFIGPDIEPEFPEVTGDPTDESNSGNNSELPMGGEDSVGDDRVVRSLCNVSALKIGARYSMISGVLKRANCQLGQVRGVAPKKKQKVGIVVSRKLAGGKVNVAISGCVVPRAHNGMTLAAAKKLIRQNGCKVGRIAYVGKAKSGKKSAVSALRASAGKGDVRAYNTKINVTVKR